MLERFKFCEITLNTDLSLMQPQLHESNIIVPIFLSLFNDKKLHDKITEY